MYRHRIAERARARERAMLAGVVAAAVYNVHRKRGSPAVRPSDFVDEGPRIVTAEEFERILGGWQAKHNAAHRAAVARGEAPE